MDYHILTQSKDKKTINVVFHFPISATGDNQAGKQWREAVVLEQGGADNIVSVLSGMPELASLKAGEIIEVQKTVRFSSVNLDNTQRENEIKAEYTELKDEIIAEKEVTLAFIGHEGTVT